jgi:hypothetical protein
MRVLLVERDTIERRERTMNEHVMRMLEQKIAEAADYVTARVASGQMTEAQGRAYVADLQAQMAKAVIGVEEKTGLTPKADDPTKGEPVDKPALVLYAEGLKRSGDYTESQISRLVLDAAAADESAIAAQAEAERVAQQAERDAVAAAKYAASPEGLAVEAKAKRANDAVFASKLEDGKTILEARGFSAEDVAILRDDEVIRFSGIDPDIAAPEQGHAGLRSNMIEGA